ncbi:MAG: PQQ-binding-like beta-propeller repeat protein [Bryobacterales bacterium]|nr:PQQ-binding-like beta-propeller repeat protein [Bryobacterales bacterium]
MKGILILVACGSALGADWPQWRGIHRDGISPETGLLKSWPAAGPKLVWKATGLGEGFSSFAVVKGRLYTQGQRGNQEYVMAYDVSNGKKTWETAAGGSFRERRGHGPRGTPTVDADRLYALSADGTLVSLDPATGKQMWGYNIVERYRGEVPNWGISESPLIDKEKLIVTPGGRNAAVVALNKSDGKPIWKSQSDGAAYSSPMVVESGGVRQYVVFTADAAIGVNASTGELLWRYDKVSNRTANIATPIIHDGHIFLSSDYGTGGGLLRLASSTGKANEVWFSREMKNHYSSSVLVGKHLYGFSSQILTAMDFLTGQVAWRDRSVGKGSVTYADGRLYVYSEQGKAALVEATPEAYKQVSSFSIPAGEFNTWTPPVIANGKLYLREQDNLYCFDIQAKP